MENRQFKLPLFFALSLMLLFSQAKETELLPEVKALFEIEPLDPGRLERNFFIVYSGITFPHDNYDKIYTSIISNNYQKIAESIDDGTFNQVKIEQISDYLNKGEKPLSLVLEDDKEKFFNPKEYSPCTQYLNRNCIEETLNKNTFITELIDKNSELITRYTKLLEQVDHNDAIIYPDKTYYYDSITPYRNHGQIHHLQLAEAIIQLKKGDFEKGLAILEYGKAMIKLILSPNSNPTLIDVMVMVAWMQLLDQTLYAILDDGLLDTELTNPRVERLFAPYTKAEHQAVFRAYQKEMFNSMFSPLYKDYFKKNNNNNLQLKLSKEDENLALIWLNSFNKLAPHLSKRYYAIDNINTEFNQEKEKFIEQLAHKNKDNRTFYEIVKSFDETVKKELAKINIIKKWEQETLQRHFSKKDITFENIIDYFSNNLTVEFYNQYYRVLQQSLTLLENDPFSETTKYFFAEHASKYPISISNDYLVRMAEQSNYHHLVYLKYRIELEKIKDADISQFLESMGELAKHPVTQEPYIWNAEERTLSIPLSESKFLPSSVRDGKSTHFKVWIRQKSLK